MAPLPNASRRLPVRDRLTFMVILLRTVTALFVLVGLSMVVGGLPKVSGWPVEVVAPGAGLAAAGLAGLVATHASVSWREQRERARAASIVTQRERVHERLLTHMTMAMNNVSTSPADEASVRSAVALWAGGETLDKLAEWHALTFKVMNERGGAPGDLKPQLHSQFYAVTRAARRELDPSLTDHQFGQDLVARMLFNDYVPTRQPEAQLDSRSD